MASWHFLLQETLLLPYFSPSSKKQKWERNESPITPELRDEEACRLYPREFQKVGDEAEQHKFQWAEVIWKDDPLPATLSTDKIEPRKASNYVGST